MKVFILPPAQVDLREAYAAYEAERVGLGNRFINEFDRLIERIKMSPEGGAVIQSEYRLRRLHKFPYGVVYLVEDVAVLIVAVYHLHRGPDFLNERLS